MKTVTNFKLESLKHERDLAWAMFMDVEQQVNELLLAREKARNRWCLLSDEVGRLEGSPKMADLRRFVEKPLPTAEQLKAMLSDDPTLTKYNSKF